MFEVRVGAKGYIHGWIYVGPDPKVGQSLTDPKGHPGEHGEITAIDSKGVHVKWSGGKQEVKSPASVKPQPAIGHPVYSPEHGWGHVKNKKGDQLQVEWHGHGGEANKKAQEAHEKYKAAKKLAADKHAAKKAGTLQEPQKPAEAPPAPKTEAPKGQPNSPAGMTPVPGPKGSNPGQWYQASDGKKYYVKSSPDASNEVGAARVYEAAGLIPGKDIAKTTVTPDGKVMSEKMDFLTAMSGADWAHGGPASDSAKKFFAVSALTANYDAAGMGHDNLLVGPNGAAMVDLGGAMGRRAQGGIKPGWKVTGTPGAVSMADDVKAMSGDGAVKNAQLKAVFGSMTNEEKAVALLDLKEKFASDPNSLIKLHKAFTDAGMSNAKAGENIAILKSRLDEIPGIAHALMAEGIAKPKPMAHEAPKANLAEHPDITATKAKLEETAKKLNAAHAAHQAAKTDETKKALANAASMHSKTKAKLTKLQAQHGAGVTPPAAPKATTPKAKVPEGDLISQHKQAKADLQSAYKAMVAAKPGADKAAAKQAYDDAIKKEFDLHQQVEEAAFNATTTVTHQQKLEGDVKATKANVDSTFSAFVKAMAGTGDIKDNPAAADAKLEYQAAVKDYNDAKKALFKFNATGIAPTAKPKSNAGKLSDFTHDNLGHLTSTKIGNFTGHHIKPEHAPPGVEQFLKDHINVHPTEHVQGQHTAASDKLFRDLNDHFEAEKKNFGPGVHEAIVAYTGSSYTAMNGALRGTSTPGPATKAKIAKMDSAMTPLPQDIAVVRRIGAASMFGTNGKDLKPGAILVDPGYMSTTVTKGSYGAGTYGTSLHITLPKGTKALWANPISQFKGSENEMILPHGTALAVTKVIKDDNGVHVHATVVPAELLKQGDATTVFTSLSKPPTALG